MAANVESGILAVPVSILYDRGQTVLPTTLLDQRIPEPYVAIHPETIADLGFSDGTKIKIEFASSEVEVTDSPGRNHTRGGGPGTAQYGSTSPRTRSS